jgi:hypothetical protein
LWDLYGKGGHIRTVPIPEWVKTAIECWTTAAPVTSGRIFRCVSKTGTVWGEGVSEKVIWCVVKEFASKAQLRNLAPHDLRRTCARLCHVAGGELEQIQFLLGHVSVQTTESTSAANRTAHRRQRPHRHRTGGLRPSPSRVLSGTDSFRKPDTWGTTGRCGHGSLSEWRVMRRPPLERLAAYNQTLAARHIRGESTTVRGETVHVAY